MSNNTPTENGRTLNMDSFWLNHANKIRQFSEMLQSQSEPLNNVLFFYQIKYSEHPNPLVKGPRMYDFLRAIYSLVEVEQAFQNQNQTSPFATIESQQILLRALGLKLDDIFSSSYSPGEEFSYYQYSLFVNQYRKFLNDLKNQFSQQPGLNIVNSLILGFYRAMGIDSNNIDQIKTNRKIFDDYFQKEPKRAQDIIKIYEALCKENHSPVTK